MLEKQRSVNRENTPEANHWVRTAEGNSRARESLINRNELRLSWFRLETERRLFGLRGPRFGYSGKTVKLYVSVNLEM